MYTYALAIVLIRFLEPSLSHVGACSVAHPLSQLTVLALQEDIPVWQSRFTALVLLPPSL